MKQKLMALMVAFVTFAMQITVFAEISQCGAEIGRGEESYFLNIPDGGVDISGGVVYEFTLPIYSDSVIIKHNSTSDTINFAVDGVSQSIALSGTETGYVFSTPLRKGEKTLELSGNATISSIEFLQITEEKAVGTIKSFHRTSFEEASKLLLL